MKWSVQGRHETAAGLHVELSPMTAAGPDLKAPTKEIVFGHEHRDLVDRHFAMFSVHDESVFVEAMSEGGSA